MMSLLLPALLGACSDQKVQVYNTAPAVSIVSPVDGAGFGPGDLVEFYGVADDSQDPATSLQISWESSIDGQLGTDPPDSEGTVYLATSVLSGGSHTITLTATDANGQQGTATINVFIGERLYLPGIAR